MSGKLSNQGEWWSALEPASERLCRGRGDPDDPRLGDIVTRWDHESPEFRAGQAVLIGFPCDKGVRRNHGRPGAAAAPDAIREALYRLTAWDGRRDIDLAKLSIVDLGNVRIGHKLEEAQDYLAKIVSHVLQAGAVPIVLGGGHETAFGHFLGYVGANRNPAIINIDAHLDVRPYPHGGHSGSPFRQAFDHSEHPLHDGCYVVIGAQPASVARAHAEFVEKHGGRIHWHKPGRGRSWLGRVLDKEMRRLDRESDGILLTVDADAFCQADVPGVSAPNPAGLAGSSAFPAFYRAGKSPAVHSVEIVEMNPRYDCDGRSARWAALTIREFLLGLARRG